MTTINTNQDYQNRVKHFTALQSKYQATQHQDSSPSSLLYLILRKVDLGLELSELELNWLQKNELTQTIEIIWVQKFRKGELKRLEDEFSQLKAKYKITKSWESSLNSFLYPILWKLDKEGHLDNDEIQLLQDKNLSQIVEIAQDIKKFAALKQKYQATKYQDSFPDKVLYSILKTLDKSQSLDDSEYEWLLENELFETIEIFEQQESKREEELNRQKELEIQKELERQEELAKQAKFTQLKEKYKANKYFEPSVASRLHEILQKLEENKKLAYYDEDWLKNRGLKQTIKIAKELEFKREFIQLKGKYNADKYADLSPDSDLYIILKKLESENTLSKDELEFLQKHQLTDTLVIANQQYGASLKHKAELGQFLNDSEIEWLQNNKHEDIITFAKQKHFSALKIKYGLIDPTLPLEPLYTIMVKLEKKERLDPVLVVQLIEEKLLSRDGKITVAHYRLEAEFLEQEIKRTGHKWHIPTASSYWRKANEPEQALKLTNLDLGKIKENNLKSAISVTRGAAFRDIDKLDDAEICAIKAMEYQPDSHQPYTLMGAICYDRFDYEEGNNWFEQAINRGADIEDIDSEIKRVIKNTKDEQKRHEAAEYLLRKDSYRYAWAKDYLKKQKDNK
ncbi:hypothetical protein [Anabaena sp. PCC 7108]|uniref:hypothetical protein n=1 Tax=Anabaena sp. PCC 7108 TaxID=163908 RepID=UPI00034CD76F|nr:hypothetical protein [Anabaena sp. PCC 7108]